MSWKINSFDGNADYFGLEIVGEKRSAGAHDTTIFADFIDAPALMIHCGYGTTIKNIAIVGQNRVDLELARNLEKYTSLDPAQATMRGLSEMFSDDKNFLQNWDTNWPSTAPPDTVKGRVRDVAQSPYAGICVDPFGDNPKGVNQYPDFIDGYDRVNHYSSGIVIQGCRIERFVVGIAISPHGAYKNAENVSVRDTTVAACKVAYALSQSQTRNVNFESCSARECLIAVDTVQYATSVAGTLPNIRGFDVERTKYVFVVSAGSSSPTMENVSCRDTAGLGFISAGNSPGDKVFSFVGCRFEFLRTVPMPDAHLATWVCVSFVGCTFAVRGGVELGQAQAYPPLTFQNGAPITFINCSLEAGPPGPGDAANQLLWANNAPAVGFHQPKLVTFDGLRVVQNTQANGSAVAGVPGASFVRRDYMGPVVSERESLIRQHVPPGARVMPTGMASSARPGDPAPPMDDLLRIVAVDLPEIDIGSVDLTVEDIESISFPNHDMTGRLLPGDLVYSPLARNAGPKFEVPYYPGPQLVTMPMLPFAPMGQIIGSMSPVLNGYVTKPDMFRYQSHGPIGVISSVTREKVVIRHVPRDFHRKIRFPANAPTPNSPSLLVVRRFGRYHPATRGSATKDSPIITVSLPLANVDEVWKPYDRIVDNQGCFPLGTYVVSATSHTITVSRNAQKPSLFGARFFDADVMLYPGELE